MHEVPSESDARQSLTAHAGAKGAELRAKYGDSIRSEQLPAILADRAIVRYPCELRFACDALEPGEFAFPEPLGESPGDGFILHVHPRFESRPDDLPILVFYQLVAVNYGPFASAGDAEAFAAEAMGITPQACYERICALADSVEPLSPPQPGTPPSRAP